MPSFTVVAAAAALASMLVPSAAGYSDFSDQNPLFVDQTYQSCNCNGTTPAKGSGSDYYVCRDSRLGPVTMPSKFPLRCVVSDYDRFGGLTPGDFLKKWTDENGQWVYPPKDGYLLDESGNSILGNITLQPGTMLDRFGGPWGRYLGAAEAPFDQRSLPPSSLNEDPAFPEWPFAYHMYEVTKPFYVQAGPIAGWFGQPGLGVQFWLGYERNVAFLLKNGFIKEIADRKQRDKGPCG